MLRKTNYKSLITGSLVTLIFSSPLFALQDSTDHNQASHQPPMATPEEAKIRHWSVPDIDKEFWDIPELENPYVSTRPTQRDDKLKVAFLENHAAKSQLLSDLANEIADKQHAELDSLLIAHQGKLVFESYFSRGRVDLSHPQSSTTKSYTALAIGRAIALGHLTMADLDKPVVGFLTGLNPSKFAQGVDNITLHDLLSMRSGLVISEENTEKYRNSPQQYQGIKQVQAFFEDSAPVTPKSKYFNYQGLNPIIVMHVLDAAVPGGAVAFIKTELMSKLGIVNYDWRTDSSGLPAAESSSSMTSRNMIKLGTLVMNKGQYQGKQLIPAAFIAKASSTMVKLSTEQTFYAGDKLSNSGYGYFWWQTDLQVGDKTYASVSAQGAGGVAIVLIAELDLVVTVNAHARQAYLQMIAEKVLPAFIR